jgi:hypothetical protein
MVHSAGSPPRVMVKRRGSKWHAAETEDWRGRETPRERDDHDDSSRDPAYGDRAAVRAQ